MTAVASKSLNTRSALLRTIVLGGLIVGIADTIVYHGIVSSLIEGNPLTSVYQFLASGALGMTAFEGGFGTVLLGVFFHFLVSFVVAAVFILSADRIPVLHRYAIPASLVYGVGVYIVMNMIILPLSAAPPLPPPTTSQLIMAILDHMLVVGLPLGILVRRSARSTQ